MTVGPIQGTLLAIARELHDLGGYAVTRLTTPVAAGATVWPVESTLLFPASGTVIARGTKYTYTSKGAATLNGLEYTDGVSVFPGAKIDLPVESSVTDFSRATTAMDLLRRSMLVDFAEGADLDIVGRNLGVPRLPGVQGDAIYREIIKALAYNPRGTVYGIELLLEAILGTGNWAIFEDLITFPNKVFIQLLGAAATNAISIGKTFLNQEALRPEDSDTQVTISGAPPIETVYSIQFADTDFLSDFRNQKPSADTKVLYPGDPGTSLWTYDGTASEATAVTQIAGEGVEIDDSGPGSVAYNHNAQVHPLSDMVFSVVQYPDSASTMSSSAGDGEQWKGSMTDATDLLSGRYMAWGCLENSGDSSKYDIGFIDSTGTFLSGAVLTTLPKDVYAEITLVKRGQQSVELRVDGALVDSRDYSSFPSTTRNRVRFGSDQGLPAYVTGRVKQAALFITTPVDMWGSRGSNGEAFPAATSDVTIEDTVAGMFLLADVGKRLTVRGSTAATGSSMTGGAATTGRNNGDFEIATFLGANRVTVQGVARSGAFVQSGTPTTFFANDDQAFQFPDDLGKEVVVSGASNPSNNGTFAITDLISEADGVTSLLSGDTPHPEKTGLAILGSASFVTETGLTWRLDPVFVNETSLDIELSDTGAEAAGVLTTRQPMIDSAADAPPERVLRISYTDVLSAQLLANVSVANSFVGPGYAYYPFYLSDPLGVLRTYLDIITAAGVIPELLE